MCCYNKTSWQKQPKSERFYFGYSSRVLEFTEGGNINRQVRDDAKNREAWILILKLQARNKRENSKGSQATQHQFPVSEVYVHILGGFFNLSLVLFILLYTPVSSVVSASSFQFNLSYFLFHYSLLILLYNSVYSTSPSLRGPLLSLLVIFSPLWLFLMEYANLKIWS